MLKHTYTDATKKKVAREFLMEYFKFRNIVGLAGPDINEYIDWCKAKGYDTFQIYEVDNTTMINQLAKLSKNVSMNYVLGDVIQADVKDDTLYDLDFCRSIVNHEDHVAKFKKNFIMTFSLRTKGGIIGTIKRFFELRKENILNMMDISGPLKQKKITTEQGDYIFISYKDTSPMCCIAKI
jgi:hypothetical protein